MGAWIAALCVVLLGAGSGAAAAGTRESGLSVLSYNVHGLFRLLARDGPHDRSAAIGWLAGRYDIVLLQEDFEYHHTIAAQMPAHAAFRGNCMGPDPRRVLAKALLLPLALALPHFSPPYGAGLTTFVDTSRLAASGVLRHAYATCSGWLGGGGDCWATKGFLRVRLRLPNGSTFDVYNTHVDAGSQDESVVARRRQLDELAAGIATYSAGRAVIAAGDFNSGFAARNRGEESPLETFRNRLRLSDTGAGPEHAMWKRRDRVLYRSGAGAELTVEEAGEAGEFVSGSRALSDHPAVFARFRVSSRE